MAAPSPYDRQYNFQDFQASSPASPLPGDKVDSEFNTVKIVTDEIIAALGLIQRADGALANGSVGVDQLNESIALGMTAPAAWETAHNYIVANSVFQGTGLYLALVSHLSGSFGVDLANGKWELLVDFDGVFTGPAGPQGEQGEEGPQGDTGATGSPGADGALWFTGSADPSGGTGSDGDFYLQNGIGATGIVGDVWEKAAGTWSITGNIRGASGAGTGDMIAANNLSDLTDVGDALDNLGISAFIQTLLDDADAATARGTLGAAKSGANTDLTSIALTTGTVSGAPSSGADIANKTYVDGIIAAQDAMVFKGVIDCSGNPNYPAADSGHTYRVSVAGKIGGASGVAVEAGDMLICLTDGTASGNQAAVGANWSIIQTNIDGAVVGPASVTDSYFAQFDGTTGKLIKARSPANALIDLGLGNVDNTSDATKNAASATLSNKTLDTGTVATTQSANDNSSKLATTTYADRAGVSPPQGRLTLQTGVPVMVSTQSAKTTIYYAPYVGASLPIYDGTNMVMRTFSEMSVATTDTTKNPAAIGASKVNDWFVWNDAGTMRLSHGPDWTSDTARSAGTALTRVNGILLNNASITNGPGASRGTYVGTTRSNSSSQLDWIYPGVAAGGTAGFFGVWNAYNRRPVRGFLGETTDSWNYTTASWRQANAAANMKISFVVGLQEDAISAAYNCYATAGSGGAGNIGVGYDSTSAFLGSPGSIYNATAMIGSFADEIPAVGLHFVAPVELGATGVIFYGDSGNPTQAQSGFRFMGWF